MCRVVNGSRLQFPVFTSNRDKQTTADGKQRQNTAHTQSEYRPFTCAATPSTVDSQTELLLGGGLNDVIKNEVILRCNIMLQLAQCIVELLIRVSLNYVVPETSCTAFYHPAALLKTLNECCNSVEHSRLHDYYINQLHGHRYGLLSRLNLLQIDIFVC